jgi:hypothetical protein
MEILNLKAAEALVARYNSITIEEIKAKNMRHFPYDTVESLTGFGSRATCTLCQALPQDRPSIMCQYCIYAIDLTIVDDENSHYCVCGEHAETYDAIEDATTPEELLTAYRNRAKHIEEILKKI